MIKQLNEVARMQQLAGILMENETNNPSNITLKAELIEYIEEEYAMYDILFFENNQEYSCSGYTKEPDNPNAIEGFMRCNLDVDGDEDYSEIINISKNKQYKMLERGDSVDVYIPIKDITFIEGQHPDELIDEVY